MDAKIFIIGTQYGILGGASQCQSDAGVEPKMSNSKLFELPNLG
jgi:hypothetical protein